MGALGRTARRLKAVLAGLFLITLAAVLAPQAARAQQKPALTATAGVGSVTLNWTRTGNTGFGYWVYRQGVTGGGYGDWIDIPGGATIRTHTVTGLTAGTSYTFQVARAEGTGLNFSVFASGGGYSNGASATPTAATTTTVPAAPTNLTATGAGTTQVLLTWTKPAGTITGYKLRYAKTPAKGSATWAAMAGSGANTVRHMVTGLEDDAEYSFMIRAVNASGDGAATGWVTATPMDSCPSVLSPTNLSLAPRSDGFVVTWMAPTDVFRNGWTLSYGKTGGSSTSVTISNAAATSRTLTGLDANTEYEISLTATHSTYNPSAVCPPGFRVKATGTTGATVAKPAAPTGLSAEAGNAQVKLTWTDPDDDSITRYQLRQKKGSAAWGSWAAISGSDADTTTHTVTGLDNDVEYSFRIRARNSGGNSAQSAVVEATPSASAAVPKPVLSAEAGYARVTLSWSALSGVTVASWGYEYKPAGGSWSTTTTVTGGSRTSITVTGLTIGTEYKFRLFAAVSPGVQSVWSDEVKATPTNTVPKPVLTATGGDASVTLSWSGLSGIPITSWGYQYKSSGGWSTTTTVTGGSRTSITVTGLTGGTEYTFRLFAAVSPGVQSVWSDQVTAKTDPLAPVLTAATSTTSERINLTWTHAGGSNAMTDADDYVRNAVRFYWWGVESRLKGETAWRAHTFNQAVPRQSPGSRSNRFGPGSVYPDGASVEVRVRATGYDSSNAVLNGPWSNIRTVTFKSDTTVALTLTGTPVTVEPGSTATYTVALTKAYAGTLRVTSDDTSAATVSPPSLTFTTGNYNTAKTVTVTGVGNGTATINHAFRLTGATVDAIPDAGTVEVTVADAPGVTVSTAALTVAEGGSGSYTMRLNAVPSSDVTITVAGASGDVTVTGSSLTFTTSNWDMPQTVTVNAATDTDTATDADVTLTHSASGGGYGSVSIASVVVSVTESGVAPSRPTGFSASGGDGSATLSWTDPGNPTITKWQYRQKAGGGAWGSWTDIPGSGAGTTSHEVSGLENGTAYQFEVRAVNTAGSGAGPDAPATVTPSAPAAPTSPPPPGSSALPARPSGLAASPGPGGVRLQWVGVDDDTITVWQVQYRESDGSYGEWSDLPGSDASTTSHLLTGLRSGTAYGFRIRAVNASGPGPSSVEVTASAGAAGSGDVVASPFTVTASEGSSAEIELCVDSPFGRSVVFEVRYGAPSSGAASASAGDYDAAVTSLAFGAGATSVMLTIPIVDDDLDEEAESFTVTFVPVGALPSGFVLENVVTTVTIEDDDSSPVLESIAGRTVDVGETVEIQVRATDADGDPVGYVWERGADEKPSQLAATMGGTRLTFTAFSSGVYTLTVTASDGHGNFDTADVVITVRSSSSSVSAPSSVVVTEGTDAAATLRIVTTQAFGRAVTFDVRYGGASAGDTAVRGSDYTVSAATSVVFGAESTSASLVVPIVDDGLDEDAESFTVTLSPSGPLPSGFALGNATTTVTIEDDDSSPVLESIEDMTVEAGAPLVLTARASDADEGDTIVYSWARRAGETPALPEDVDLDGAQLVFTPAEGVYTLTVTASDDHGNFAAEDVVITAVVLRGVTVTPTSLQVEEGGTATYTLVLDARPSASVTVAVSASAGDVTAEPSALTFSPSDWSTPRTVTVRAGEDADAVTDAEVTLSHGASGGGYDSLSVDAVTVGVVETDIAGVTLTPMSLQVLEGGAVVYTVVLDTQPLAAVTVTASSDSDSVTLSPSSLVFTSSDWSTPQTVTVEALKDSDLDDETVTVRHTASGADYDGVSAPSVMVMVTDRTLAARMGRANRSLLPQVASAIESQSLDAVTSRIEASSSGGVSTDVSLGGALGSLVGPGAGGRGFGGWSGEGQGQGLGALPGSGPPVGAAGGAGGVPSAAGGLHPAGAPGGSAGRYSGGRRLVDLLDGAAFTVPVGASGDIDGSGDGGADGSGDSAARLPVTLWGRGGSLSLSGSDHGVSWDGGLWSGHLGADVRLRRDLLVGASVSHYQVDLDADVVDGGGSNGAGGSARSRFGHDTELTLLRPYVAWLSPGGASVWASGSYGRGAVRIGGEEAARERVDMSLMSLSLGGGGVLSASPDLIAGGLTRLSLRGEGSVVLAESEAGADLAELRVDTQRLRVALEGSHERSLSGGGRLTPALELGLRHDGGDALSGAGVEAGASLVWRAPSSGLTVELRSRTLLVHERDREEWGVSALVRLDPGVEGEGLFLTVSPSSGAVQSGIGQMFSRTPMSSSLAPAGIGPQPGRLEAEIGRGFLLAGPGRSSLLTPYAGLTAADRAGRQWRLGARYRLHQGIDFGLELQRSESPTERAGHGLTLQGRMAW